jgi:hypothetical protein
MLAGFLAVAACGGDSECEQTCEGMKDDVRRVVLLNSGRTPDDLCHEQSLHDATTCDECAAAFEKEFGLQLEGSDWCTWR